MLTLEFTKTKIRAAYKNRKGTFIKEFDKSDGAALEKFVKKFRKAFVILKSEKVYLRFETYPAGKRNITSIVETNKRKYFPVDISRYDLAYKIYGSKVVVAAVLSSVVEYYLDFVKRLNISCAGVGFAAYEYAKTINDGEDSFLFVKSSANETYAAHIENGVKSVRHIFLSEFSFSFRQAFGILDFSTVKKVYATEETPEIKESFPEAEIIDCIPIKKIDLNFIQKPKNNYLSALLIVFAFLITFAGIAVFKVAANKTSEPFQYYVSRRTLDFFDAAVEAAGTQILFESISCDENGFNAKCRAENQDDAQDFLEKIRAVEESFSAREFRDDGAFVSFTVTFSLQ